MNGATTRFERESSDLQLLLDSIRTENMELKHTVEEKTHWIEVLEERSRTQSEMYGRPRTPGSPDEKESIGFSLLSMEVCLFKYLNYLRMISLNMALFCLLFL